jgi:hypothetical protein
MASVHCWGLSLKGVGVAVRVLEKLLGIRRSSIVLGAGLVGLAFPAGAMATLTRDHITTGAISTPAQGFKLSLDLLQGGGTGGYGGRNAPNINVFLNRTTGSATQVNDYLFQNPGLVVCGSKSKCGKDDLSLDYAQVKGPFANKRGSINMTFHPNGSKYKVTVPKGCGRSGYSRHGTLTGKLVLNADNLKTVKFTKIKVTLSTAIRNVACPTPHGTWLFGYRGLTTSLGLSVWQAAGSNTVREEISKQVIGSNFQFIHCYTVSAPSSGMPVPYTHSSDLSSATVNGTGGIQGSANYTGKKENKRHISSGKLTGNLSAMTAAVGVISVFASPTQAIKPSYQQVSTLTPFTTNPMC